MLRLFRSKWFVLSLVTVVILVVMGASVSKNSKAGWINNIISVPLTPVQSFFTSAGRSIGDGMAFFKNMDSLRKENDKLKTQVAELEKQNSELAALKAKNDDLRQALDLKARFSDYKTVGGNITAVDPGNWFNIFRIDVGSREGIKADYPVVTSSNGLVGRILSSDLTSSKVLTIIDEESAVAGWISKAGGGHAIVKGDLTLKEQGLCKLVDIPLEVDVEVGDVIETSGLGGIFPKGILIGKVTEVMKTNSEMDRYAIIQPAADFKRLEEVYVLKSSNNNEEIGSVEK